MGPQGDDDGLKIQKYKMTTNVKKTLDVIARIYKKCIKDVSGTAQILKQSKQGFDAIILVNCRKRCL